MDSIFRFILKILLFLRSIGLIFNKFILKMQINLSKKRVNQFKCDFNSTAKECGMIVQDSEWKFELPVKYEKEEIFLNGMNSNGNLFILKLQRKCEDHIWYHYVNMLIKINDEIYELVDSDMTNEYSKDYVCNDLKINILSPFRLVRVTYRGYMKKVLNDIYSDENENKLVFMNINLLWYSLSEVFDFRFDNDVDFLLNKSSVKDTFNLCDIQNRIEQYGNLKGIIQIENLVRHEINFHGMKCKTFNSFENEQGEYFERYFGYCKEGFGFHFGSARDDNERLIYNYGNCLPGMVSVFPIRNKKQITNDCVEISTDFNFEMRIEYIGDEIKLSESFSYLKVNINGIDGCCLIVKENSQTIITCERDIEKICFPILSDDGRNVVTDISDNISMNEKLTGGKGSSLAKLYSITRSTEHSPVSFQVPHGIIVTTSAYDLFVSSNISVTDAIKELAISIWTHESEELVREKCELVKSKIYESGLPAEVKNEINWCLGHDADSIKYVSFAVRSSAVDEDTCDLSAAGQMSTYLGIHGYENIFSAVLKCWASLYDYIAVEYRHSYGLAIESRMAVVIQEMIDCDTAGVMFTCSPLTGDEREILITCNYGLCESVVSAKSEPDTILLEVNPIEKKIINIKSIEIGSKLIKTTLANEEGTVDEELIKNERDCCCINNNQAYQIGNIGLFLSKIFGGARDIEWGFKEHKIFIFQARPVTNLNKFIDWEIMHEFDTAQQNENEIITKANVGEVMPGALTPITISLLFRAWNVPTFVRGKKTGELDRLNHSPFGLPLFAILYNQIFINMKHEKIKILGEDTQYSKGISIAVFGHYIKLEELLSLPTKINLNKRNIFLKTSWGANTFIELFFTQKIVKRKVNKYRNFQLINEKQTFKSSSELFNFITSNIEPIFDTVATHGIATKMSSIWYTILASILAKDQDETSLLKDISLLLANCENIISSQIPKELNDIANSIEDSEYFRNLSDQEALDYLENSDTKSGSLFKKFIDSYGHRGYKEFELSIKQWDENPMPVIKSLKNICCCKNDRKEKSSSSFNINEAMNGLNAHLTKFEKFLLKNIIIPRVRKSVGIREESKSLLMLVNNQYRKALFKLANMMCFEEGLIPEPELLFHLSLDEIEILLKERNPMLIAKAKQRKKLFSKVNHIEFDEIVFGPEFSSKNDDDSNEGKSNGNLMKIFGNPVCLGIVEGRALVVNHFDEIHQIQPGDILITKSTDVGWSPYFPVLAGVVTEIGGLVSHGAVIAREYGLPCIIGAKDCTKIFSTGDKVLLNVDNQGFIAKI